MSFASANTACGAIECAALFKVDVDVQALFDRVKISRFNFPGIGYT